MDAKYIVIGGAIALLIIGGVTTNALLSKEDKEIVETAEVSEPSSNESLFSLKKKEPQMVNLIQIDDPIGNTSPTRFVAPEDDIFGSLTSLTTIDVENGQLELPANFTDSAFTATVAERKSAAIVVHYNFLSDGMVTWENIMADDPHHKWEDHPEYISMKQGSKAIVTYTYSADTEDWVGSVKILG